MLAGQWSQVASSRWCATLGWSCLPARGSADFSVGSDVDLLAARGSITYHMEMLLCIFGYCCLYQLRLYDIVDVIVYYSTSTLYRIIDNGRKYSH